MPAYNAAKTIVFAISSVQSQTLKEWELIVINDGSKDETGKILDQIAQEDSRVRVIHQQNSGVAAARKKGIQEATGEYCIHVDADDWVEPDYLESLYNKAKQLNADLVWCDAFHSKRLQTGEIEDRVWPHICFEDSKTMIRRILRQEFWGCFWNKLIRTSICQRDDVKMPVPCQIWEDVSFVCQVLIHCNTIAHVAKPLYHYNTGNEESLLHQQLSQTGRFSGDIQHAINCINDTYEMSGIHDFDYELTWQKLSSIRDYIDDKRYRDYDKFMNTYPDVLPLMRTYPKYPKRLFWVYQALKYHMSFFVPVIMKFDSIYRCLHK